MRAPVVEGGGIVFSPPPQTVFPISHSRGGGGEGRPETERRDSTATTQACSDHRLYIKVFSILFILLFFSPVLTGSHCTFNTYNLNVNNVILHYASINMVCYQKQNFKKHLIGFFINLHFKNDGHNLILFKTTRLSLVES